MGDLDGIGVITESVAEQLNERQPMDYRSQRCAERHPPSARRVPTRSSARVTLLNVFENNDVRRFNSWNTRSEPFRFPWGFP